MLNKKKLACLVITIIVSTTFTGCYLQGQFTPAELMPAGIIVTNVKGPNAAATIGMRTGANLDNVGFSKTGEATCSAFMGIVSAGDCSINAAMQNGGISKVHHVDFQHSVILGGLADSHTTIVHGE